jgi:uncharacterized protein YbjT (DUF2867 family)
MKVLVFGATGDQGAAQIDRLRAAGHRPIAAGRHPERSSGEAIFADFAEPASLAAAIDGMEAIFLTLPSTSFQPAEPLIAATDIIARAAAAAPSVRMLIFNSSLPMAPEKLGFAAQDARIEMRARLFAAGIPTVVLAPVVFLDNLLKGWVWPTLVRQGKIVYPHPDSLQVSWICHDDLAALMVAALGRPDLAGRTFAVGGPEALRGPELARRLSLAWRRKLTFESQSLDDFTARISDLFGGSGALPTGRMMAELRRIYTWYQTDPSHPFLVDMKPVLALLPTSLSSLESWAARHPLPSESLDISGATELPN